MTKPEDVADEYRIAYLQLKRHEAGASQLEEQLEREYRLSRKRYEMARAAWIALALGPDERDEFMDVQALDSE